MPTYSDITDIKLLPIYGLRLYFDNGDSTENMHEWVACIEKESSWNLDPITMRDRNGMDIAVAYKFSGTFYIPQTNYQDQHSVLIDLLDKPLSHWRMNLGGVGTGDGYANAAIQVDKASGFNGCSHSLTYRKEKVEWRPRLIIDIQGRYSKDVLRSTTDRFFAQGTGF